MVAALCLLSACAQPTTLTPAISPDEVAAERAHQKDMIHGTVKLDYDAVSYGKRERIAMQKSLQRVTDKLKPEATQLCREMGRSQDECRMYVELIRGKGVNAHADGEKIVFYMGMVDFAKNENQLAFVLAHEYTHHMMGHVQSAQQNIIGGALLGTLADALAASQGVSTQGQFGQLGATAAMLSYSPSFEQEADYIALYMLDRAGFNTKDAPEFWRLMARYNPNGIEHRSTHPTTPERFVMMDKTIAEIQHKKKRGLPLRPNMQPQTN